MCALLALQVLGGLGCPAPAGITEELVQTPFGLVSISNIHAVPEDTQRRRNNHRLGPFTNIPAAGGQKLLGQQGTFAYWTNTASSPIAAFSTSWFVPPTPSNFDGQGVNLFNALLGGDVTLYPKLQFGIGRAGGGAFWTVASWVKVGSNFFHSPITQVLPGQGLTGVMKLVGTSGSGSQKTFNWNSAFSGIPRTSLSVSTSSVLTTAYEQFTVDSLVTHTLDNP
ncbi:hypothetical protein BDZ97DRAFT_1925047 [Flammula alnicola]|nr:hypothetical protein BDZ97DRAFT_1925047 [Flammula alnicola]